MNKEYRHLTPSEIDQLQQQGCSHSDWTRVLVDSKFNTEYIHYARLSGDIRLGRNDAVFKLPGGIEKHSGIFNAMLHNVTVGDNCCIDNVKNYIANYDIDNDVYIENVGLMVVDGMSSFGNGVEVSVLIETGGREVTIHNSLSSHEAYMMAMYRHRPELIKKLRAIAQSEADSVRSDRGRVGSHTAIVNVECLRNVMIDNYCSIEGAARLTNGWLVGRPDAPVYIGSRVIADDFIVQSGSKVEDGAMLTRCFVGQSCYIGHGYTASDSLFFSNCHGENGEACAIFAGPFTVTHHKSTLLIAGMFSFMNAGSGSNQSNHMYKLGPIHQGTLERGAKTTSDSYVLWPARVGAFSLVMGRHTTNSDTSLMPFSYLIEHQGETYIVPGVNLRSVGTIRDEKKWPKRDGRPETGRLDFINYNLLSPFTVQKMEAAIKILNDLKNKVSSDHGVYTYQNANIKESSLEHGLRYYDIAIKKFIGNSVVNRLHNSNIATEAEMRLRLLPYTEAGEGKWVDLSGLIAPKSEIDRLENDIEQSVITTPTELAERFEQLYKSYYDMEWTWAYHLMLRYFSLDPERITSKDIINIVKLWAESVTTLDSMVYDDAKKEFSLASQTGFGIDGDDMERDLDFQQVRGTFDENSFVMTTLGHMQRKQLLADSMIEQLKSIRR